MIKNKWLQWVLIALPAIALLGSGFAKLSGAEQVTTGFAAMGLSPYVTVIGVLEILIVVLFLVPATRNIGFFLVCSYLGGAIVAHLSRNQPFMAPVVILGLVWVAMFLTKPGLFLPGRTA